MLLHISFWVLMTLLPLFSGPQNTGGNNFFSPWHLHMILMNSLLAVQFYFNAFFLVPVFLNKRKQPGWYFFLTLASATILEIIVAYYRPKMPDFFMAAHFNHPPPPLFFRFNILPMAAITAASLAYRYLSDHFKDINNRHNIANATLASELALLRSQISPHFIFNVINGAVSLSRTNPPAVEPTLIQLSHLMRYMLYIKDDAYITLSQKVDYLESYIELQKLRFGNEVKVNCRMDVASPEKRLEPMLLIPFVENAFKHGTNGVESPEINIRLATDDRLLIFSVSNAIGITTNTADEYHGIGLNNVKRRLALLYPDKHKLIIKQTTEFYSIDLQIQLK